MKYSPDPATVRNYGVGGLLGGDPEAQNLAWLSHDLSKGPHPDPNFTTLVRRTLQTVMKTGQIDLVEAFPVHLKVRWLLRLPPAQAVARLQAIPALPTLPLSVAYGPGWLETVKARARLYREPFDLMLDAPVNDLTQALAVIDASK